MLIVQFDFNQLFHFLFVSRRILICLKNLVSKIEAGVPAHVLQKLLGHEDISETINTYTDVFERYEKKYDKTIEDYYANNNIILDNIDPIDVIKNDLKNIIESINISHLNSKQKSILLEYVKKIDEWYKML